MKAYIVGMIAGTICLVAPFFYLSTVHRYLGKVMLEDPNFAQQFESHVPDAIVYGSAAVGAFVLLLCTAMVVRDGLARSKAAATAAPSPEPRDEAVPETLSAPLTIDDEPAA